MNQRYEGFFKIKKRDKLVNAAMEEFSQSQYATSSLNNILEKAGMSKGGYYHHFKSKDDMFQCMCIFTQCIYQERLFETIDQEGSDLLNRVRQYAMVQIQIMIEYPYFFAFLNYISSSPDMSNFPDILEEINELHKKVLKCIFEDVNTNLLKYPEKSEESKQLVQYTLAGFSSLLNERLSAEECMADLEKLLRFLRFLLYKENC